MGCFGDVETAEARTKGVTQYKTPQQRKYIKEALELYGPTVGAGMAVYPGSRVAPFSPLQEKVFNFAEAGGLMTTPQQTAEYYRDVLKRPAEKEFAEYGLPAVREAYSGPGYWSGPRAESEVRARRDLSDALMQRWGQLNWDVLQANKQGAIQQFGLGSAQQQQEQNIIGAEMQKFAEESQLTDPTNLAVLMSLLGMPITTVTKGQQLQIDPGWHTADWASFGAQVAPMIKGGLSGAAGGATFANPMAVMGAPAGF